MAVTAWYVGMPAGLLLAAGAATLWFVSEVSTHAGASLSAAVWNGFTRLVIYTSTPILLALVRADRNRLHALLDALEPLAQRYPGTGLGASVGFAQLAPDAALDDVLKIADSAMYAAKARRKGLAAMT